MVDLGIVSFNREPVSIIQFMEILDVVDEYIDLLRPYRKNQLALNDALNITKEMRFVALFSPRFRAVFYNDLNVLFDDLYLEIHEEVHEVEEAS